MISKVKVEVRRSKRERSEKKRSTFLHKNPAKSKKTTLTHGGSQHAMYEDITGAAAAARTTTGKEGEHYGALRWWW
jgi:hypothetical protein